MLEDGSVFHGHSIGINGFSIGEVVFNTSMTGYQEIITDPSYTKQLVCLTYPHIGNVGTNIDDEEWISVNEVSIEEGKSAIGAAGLIIRDFSRFAHNWRNTQDLPSFLEQNKIVAIAGIDTRKLTRKLQLKGALNGCIYSGALNGQDKALELARTFVGIKGLDLAQEVTTKTIYSWQEGVWSLDNSRPENALAKDNAVHPLHVVVYDYGVKRTILRILVDVGCRVTVVPAKTSVGKVMALKPDGVLLSNGPGDPEPCDYAIENIKELIMKHIPLMGICLGHQLLALASGAKTEKMKFGHHGANHPVQCLESKQVFITSQNHGFAIEERSMPGNLRITHRSLFDNTIQGVERTDVPAFSFQGHPEASPGPQDISVLFEKFFERMRR